LPLKWDDVEASRLARWLNLLEPEPRQRIHDPVRLQAERHDAADQVDNVARLFVLTGPVVRVVDDSGSLVGLDLVPLKDPVQSGT
jgi:hypothetical protein